MYVYVIALRTAVITKVERNMSSTILHKHDGDLKYHTLNINTPKQFVYHVELNRPKQLNAFNKDLFV